MYTFARMRFFNLQKAQIRTAVKLEYTRVCFTHNQTGFNILNQIRINGY